MKKNNLLLPALLIFSGIVSADSFIFFNSEKDDYIGQGETRVWASGSFSSNSTQDKPNVVSINFTSDENWWNLDFAAPENQTLSVGSYTNATRYPFQESNENGLSVSGSGRGCNTLEGQFEVLEISYDADGKLSSFAATFEQHCEKADPALFGTVSFNSSLSTPTTTVPDNVNITVDLKANSVDGPVTIKAGDTVNLNWSIQTDSTDITAEYWLGLIGTSSEKKWFNSGRWQNTPGSLIWKTDTVKSAQRDFSWTPQVPGIYMLQLILDTQTTSPVKIDQLSAHDHVVIIVE